MKRFFYMILLFTMATVGSMTTAGQNMPADMEKYYMCLARRGPKWIGPQQPGSETELANHLEYVKKMAVSGKLVAAGPFIDGGEITGIFVLRAASIDEAKALIGEEPWTKAERLSLEVIPWWALKGLGQEYSAEVKRNPGAEIPTVDYQIGLLKRGPKWTAERTPETEQLQANHLAHIGKMAESGKLAVAGPFENGGDLRGVFLFRVSRMEEAKAMSENDPAVRAGRLTVELHPWKTYKGMMP